MASTFSNLKFELIGTGDQSGTWGTTTNTNLGTAIEQALVGMATISSGFVTNSLTLTLTDTNAAQNARALVLNLTQALSGAGTLNVPAIQKPYMIINATGQTVTVKVTGLTGVAVPNGTRAFLYNNGTDVGDFFNYASSLTLGTALPITSGGTGTTSTTFVNLTTNVTGTLPIANGGTGTTSTTFVNLATNVTGSLPIANGGTGTNTLTANNVILGNGASALQFVAPGTNGNVLTSNGTTWTSTAATAVNNGTLTMNVSGTGLSGSQTFTANQSSAATFTVTSNATNANTASTIVARDASGNFSAGTITATLSGSATQVSNNLTLATSGTGLTGSATFNGSSAQTFTVTSNATSANTASTIVARDASGNFSAGTITASLTGNASGSAATFTSTSQNSQFNSIGVGTAASGTAGEIRATNNVTAYYSDDRLKTRLGDIENALDKLCTLSGFYYQANKTAQELGYEAIREVGVSAQSVQKVLPEVVVPAPIDDKYLTVRYEKLIPLIIEAIKELRAEVKALKGE